MLNDDLLYVSKLNEKKTDELEKRKIAFVSEVMLSSEILYGSNCTLEKNMNVQKYIQNALVAIPYTRVYKMIITDIIQHYPIPDYLVTLKFTFSLAISRSFNLSHDRKLG